MFTDSKYLGIKIPRLAYAFVSEEHFAIYKLLKHM